MLDMSGKNQPEKTGGFRKFCHFQASFISVRAKQNKPPTTKIPSIFFRKFIYEHYYGLLVS